MRGETVARAYTSCPPIDPKQRETAMSQPPAPTFRPDAPHHQRPKLRAVRGFPAKHGDQTVLGLSDARQISDRVVFTAPAAQMILPHLNGQKDLDAIVTAVGRGLRRADLELLVAQLDDAGLLEGPTFDAMLAKVRSDFDSAPHLPPASTAGIADALVTNELGESATEDQKASMGPGKLRAAMDAWIKEGLKEVTDPSFDALPKGIIAPHLDYWRGWVNYAHAYGRLRVVDRPDRVLILGTNHFGHATGVCGCDKGFQTPLGLSRIDGPLVEALRARLGPEQSERLFAHRYDHEREHSVELQVPWIQHVFGAGPDGAFVPVFGALVHDPAPNNGESYDGAGLGLMAFIDAARGAIADVGGRTLVVSSADLSHIGASFGDQVPITGETEQATEFRNRVLQHDREMLELVSQGQAEQLVAAMAWQQNPTRWCSVGNIVAMMKITGASNVKLLSYTMAGDQQGVAMVSSCAAAVV